MKGYFYNKKSTCFILNYMNNVACTVIKVVVKATFCLKFYLLIKQKKRCKYL